MAAEHAHRVADALGWLLGYRVDSPDGRVGVVEAVRRGVDGASLVVRSGLYARTATAVPLATVASIAPDRRRVVLSAPPPRP